MKTLCFFFVSMGLMLAVSTLSAQACVFQVRPVYAGSALTPETPIILDNSDTIRLSTFRCYMGNFVFLKENKPVFEEKRYRLIDFEAEKSMSLLFPEMAASTEFDEIRFTLGVDSLTNVSGAMGGDLDPTKGMFWTWQSGYINVKIEGEYASTTFGKHQLEFHLGGYAHPYATAREVTIKHLSPNARTLDIDLTPFFYADILANTSRIMSPGIHAVRLMAILANSIIVHE